MGTQRQTRPRLALPELYREVRPGGADVAAEGERPGHRAQGVAQQVLHWVRVLDLGFGRIVASEIEVPNFLANTVHSG